MINIMFLNMMVSFMVIISNMDTQHNIFINYIIIIIFTIWI